MAWGSSMDHRPRHGLRWLQVPRWPFEEVQSGNRTSSWASIVTQSQGDPEVRELSLHLLKLQVAVYHPTDPLGNDVWNSALLSYVLPPLHLQLPSLHSAHSASVF